MLVGGGGGGGGEWEGLARIWLDINQLFHVSASAPQLA